MFDRQRIGRQRLHRRRAGRGALPKSSSRRICSPKVSAHLSPVTPARDRLEIVDWAAPLLHEPLSVEPKRHRARPAGTGECWDEDAVKHFAC
jgi:hypothetical protein